MYIFLLIQNNSVTAVRSLGLVYGLSQALAKTVHGRIDYASEKIVHFSCSFEF
jgi:hypothetical protein